MDFQHAPSCPHCGEAHSPAIKFLAVPAAPATRTMRQGPYHDPESGLVIGTNDWRRVRCVFCETELMTPAELLPLCSRDETYMGQCGPCTHDLLNGQRPGTTQRRLAN